MQIGIRQSVLTFFPMLILICFAFLLPLASTNLVPLSTFSSTETLYRVGKTSRVYVISNSPQDDIQALTLSTERAGQNSNGFTLSVPQTDGSLTPLQSTADGDLLSVIFSGNIPLTGWLYICNVTSELNVFPLKDDSTIIYKPGTNVFFRMNTGNGKIPVAENVVISNNVDLSGFVGLPDETNPVQFFGSSSIAGVTTYSQLELPMAIFHFTSSGTNVKYEIKYAVRAGMEIGSSGLVMTDDFPTGTFATKEFSLVNPSEANIELFLVPRLDKSQAYGGNVTVFAGSVEPTVFPMLSIADSNITSNSPMNRIVIESDGPFSVQYTLKDLTVTTAAPVVTTTKSSSIAQIFVSLLVAAVLRI